METILYAALSKRSWIVSSTKIYFGLLILNNNLNNHVSFGHFELDRGYVL